MTLPTPPTLPPLAFAKLAPSRYLSAHLSSSNPVRPSNRTTKNVRFPHIHTGSLSHAHGSAVVRTGDTSAVCSVRGEILKKEDIVDWTPSTPEDEEEDKVDDQPAYKRRRLDEREDIAHLNLLVPNVELATGCSPSNIPTGSGAPSVAAQVLAQRIETLLHTADIIPLKTLRIWSTRDGGGTEVEEQVGEEETDDVVQEGKRREVKAFWVLFIDIVLLSLNGPAMDVAWLAMMAALRNTRIPFAEWDWDAEGVICDSKPSLAKGLGLRDVPVVLSFGVFDGNAYGAEQQKHAKRKWILADPDGFEEALCKETVVVAVGAGGKLLRIEKGGGGSVGFEDMQGCVEEAQMWRERCVDVFQG